MSAAPPPSGRFQAIGQAAGQLWGRAAGLLRSSPDAPPSEAAPALHLPVLWLLGKTGAGKSSLVCAITQSDAAEVGLGFAPCTRTAQVFEYPPDEPVLRFLDTRGLGEVGYDPAEDLQAIGDSAHMALVLARLDDPVQGQVADALRQIRRKQSHLPVIVLHTAADLPPDDSALARVRSANQRTLETAWGGPLPSVTLDLSNPALADLTELKNALVDGLPSVVQFMAQESASTQEDVEFAQQRNLVLRFAGSASAAGALPVALVGAISVPGLQLAMLAKLAQRYGVDWNKRRLAELGAALGVGVLGGQGLGLAARELAKLVPLVGQSAAPVAGATWGFAATYALGRAAAWWFYKLRAGEPVDQAELRQRFAQALKTVPRRDGR